MKVSRMLHDALSLLPRCDIILCFASEVVDVSGIFEVSFTFVHLLSVFVILIFPILTRQEFHFESAPHVSSRSCSLVILYFLCLVVLWQHEIERPTESKWCEHGLVTLRQDFRNLCVYLITNSCQHSTALTDGDSSFTKYVWQTLHCKQSYSYSILCFSKIASSSSFSFSEIGGNAEFSDSWSESNLLMKVSLRKEFSTTASPF